MFQGQATSICQTRIITLIKNSKQPLNPTEKKTSILNESTHKLHKRQLSHKKILKSQKKIPLLIHLKFFL